jgi:thioredoxin-dependent peroxiredoxin
LSNEQHEVAEKYDVGKLKRLYGREYLGIERSIFLINPDGKLAQAWRKVKVNGHIDASNEPWKRSDNKRNSTSQICIL